MKFIRTLFKFTLVIIPSALQASPMSPVMVKFAAPNIEDLSDPMQKEFMGKIWPNFCQQLGSNLSIGARRDQKGFFKSFSCKNQKIESTDIWWIETSLSEQKGLNLVIKHRWTLQDEPQIEAALQIPWHVKMPAALDKGSVTQAMGGVLLDQLPADHYFKLGPHHTLTSVGYQPTDTPGSKTNQEPLFLFELNESQGQQLWLPKIVGSAKPASPGGLWTIEGPSSLAPDQTVWGKNKRGRGALAQEEVDGMNEALRKQGVDVSLLEGLVFDTIKGGYAGIRYGKVFGNTDALLSNASIVGMLVEIRNGPLKGLRWYWDFSPETKAVIDGQQFHFKWSRASLAWSFGKNFDLPLLARVDFVPKIGLMDFDSRLPVKDVDNVTQPVSFSLNNASSFGGEIGAESSYPWFLLRLWAATDFSKYISLGGDGSVRSLRAGADTYWDIIELSSRYKVALLVFAAGERMRVLAAPNKKTNVPNSENQVAGIEYAFGYAGAGVTLRW